MAEKILGVVDEPNPKYGKDSLGIKRHGDALASFIYRTNTPITIGIQGEWGSGKTSLLNSIYSTLNDEGQCRQIWINAWEHSLLVSPEEALLKITSEIIQEMVATDGDTKRSEQVKKVAGGLFKGALRVGATAALGDKAGQITDELLAESSSSIKILREQLAKIACEVKEKDTNPYQRFVIYVDDLDRIEPRAAVIILELLKNIFSVPNCIFVLAIDYQVVVKGLESKFGKRTEGNEWEFRAFFDKIIQLPFMMPMGQYDIGLYVGDLLQQIGFDPDSRLDGSDLQEIISTTIGGNPRSLKRMVNSLSLIDVFLDTAENNEQDLFDDLDRLMLFGLVCLQVSFPDLYDLLNSNPDFLRWDQDLASQTTRHKEEKDPQFPQALEIAKKTGEFDEEWEQVIFSVCYANPRQRSRVRDASQFFNILRDRFTSTRSPSLPERISKILNYTSVTTVSTSDATQNRKTTKDFSKYTFQGKELGKAALARAIVTHYVKEHPGISLAELKDVFPDEVQGKAVVVKLEEAEELLQKTGYKRFAMKGDQILELSDCQACISNQWGIGNVDKIVKAAKDQGMNFM